MCTGSISHVEYDSDCDMHVLILQGQAKAEALSKTSLVHVHVVYLNKVQQVVDLYV